MSTAEVVEQRSLTTQSSHQHLAFDDIEVTGFRLGFASHSHRASHMSVINVDDDASEAAGNTRPRSHLASQPSFSISGDNGPPATRRRSAEDHPVIVIDNTGSRETRTQRGTNNGAESSPIIVLDSDEEQGSASSSHQRRRRRVPASSFRIFSPPPPPQQHHHAPPVPSIPPIIAEPLPFGILPPSANGNQGRARIFSDETPQPVSNGNNSAAHGNGIHLGGGLFSRGNRSGNRHSPRTHVHFQPYPLDFNDLVDESGHNQLLNRTTSWFGRFFASYVSGGGFLSSQSGQNTSSRRRSGMNFGRILPLPFPHAPELVGGEHPSNENFFRVSHDGLGPLGRRDAAIGLGPDYNKSMTHPERAGPGWTFDIGSELAEGSSKVDGSEILVCAMCLDPLLANSDGMVDVTEEERKGRRVWGLRCGHVLDGKCVESLMRPEQGNDSADNEGTNEDVDSQCTSITKGKGKAKAKRKKVVPDHAGENEVKGLVTIPNVKGKGKVPPVPNDVPTSPSLVDGAKTPSAPSSTELVGSLPTEESSIRSRLRPRRSTGVPSSSPIAITCSYRPATRQPALGRASAHGGSSSTRRRGTKRRRSTATAATVEAVEENYEWTCPISGCGRVHVSIKVDGQWRMDPELGAVGIFV